MRIIVNWKKDKRVAEVRQGKKPKSSVFMLFLQFIDDGGWDGRED